MSSYCAGDEPEDTRALIQSFLDERPAVCPGIVRLETCLQMLGAMDYWGEREFDARELKRWCDEIAQKLDLQIAWFNIYATKSDLNLFSEWKESSLDSLTLISKLRISDWVGVK